MGSPVVIKYFRDKGIVAEKVAVDGIYLVRRLIGYTLHYRQFILDVAGQRIPHVRTDHSRWVRTKPWWF